MRKYLFFLASVFLLTACDENLRLYKQQEIKGKLFLEDTLAGVPNVIAPEASVYIIDETADSAKSVFYNYSVKADKEGVFTVAYQPFEKLNSGSNTVYLTSKFTNTSAIPFESIYSVAKLPLPNVNGERELFLRPQYPKGVIKVIAKDSTDEPIVGVEVFVFKNKIQAATITEDSPQGFITKTTTNSKGFALFYNLSTGNHYVVGKAKGVGMYLLSEQATIHISDTVSVNYPRTIKYKILEYEKPQTSTLKNEIKVIAKSAASPAEPLANAEVYLFTSSAQAGTINDKTVQGYIQSVKTDAKGEVSFKNLASGKYYIGVRAIFENKLRVADIQNAAILQDGVTHTRTFLL